MNYKIATLAVCLTTVSGYSIAEPAQIDKQAIMSAYVANQAERKGSWLKWACEEYRNWYGKSGSLWKKTDTPKENLAAGLCAGFIAGVAHAPGSIPCLSRHPSAPDVVLDYLNQHPERMLDPAGQLVVDALAADRLCKQR